VSTVQEIKQAIEQLPKEDFWKLSAWVIERQESEWDRQIEEDVRAGRLDELSQAAIADLKAGRTRPFPE
jgi:hypothetical protein